MREGKHAQAMLQQPLKAYLLLGVEAELDAHDPRQALAALQQAELVVAMSPYQHNAVDYAHVLLPVAPFTETAGTFINTEGRVQSFGGVVMPLGETRPAWKVLRVLGNLLGLGGFDYDSAEDVKREALAGKEEISNKINNLYDYSDIGEVVRAESGDLQRIAEVPIYAADAIVRRAPALQKTRDAAPPVATMNRALADKMGLREGDQLRLQQGEGVAVVPYAVDDRLPADCIRLAAARPETAALGAATAGIRAERVAAQHKVAV